MHIQATRIDDSFAATLSGLDLARSPVTDDDIAATETVIASYPVLCLRNQPISDQQQKSFMRCFGPLLVNEYPELGGKSDRSEHLIDVATIDEQGEKFDANTARGMMQLANLMWHTDGSQTQPPLRLTALSAKRLPAVPPPTLFADMRAAWAALSPERQQMLEGMMVEHSIFASRAKIGMREEQFSETMRRNNPPVVHPLVRTHPRTGQKSLYLASHASRIVGWPVDAGRALLQELTEFATQPQFQYRHRWQPHDLLIWDNSRTMHRAVAYDGAEPRVLRWSGVFELENV